MPPQPESPSYVESTPLDKRKAEAEKVLLKYNGQRIPIIVEKAKSAKISVIDKRKYLVPDNMTYAQFVHVIRKRIKLTPEEAIFLFINNVIPPSSATMGQLYREHKDEDDFLKAIYSNENAYGSR
jgi:GABA(A) receptor-associated protein